MIKTMNNNETLKLKLLNRCRVCGFKFDKDYFPWGPEGDTPSYDMCDRCHTMFGYEDEAAAIILRQRGRVLSKYPDLASEIEADVLKLPLEIR